MEHLLTDIFDIFCSPATDSDAYEDKQMMCINDLLLEDNQGFWLETLQIFEAFNTNTKKIKKK